MTADPIEAVSEDGGAKRGHKPAYEKQAEQLKALLRNYKYGICPENKNKEIFK